MPLPRVSPDDLRRILDAHDEWVASKGKRGRRAQLAFMDLSGAGMRRANLSGADLSGTNLSHVDLTEARLMGACLSGAYVRDSMLSSANFKRAVLTKAVFAGVLMHGTIFAGAVGVYDAGMDRYGHRFIGVDHGDHVMIAAGRRWFTVEKAHEYWGAKGTPAALRRVEKIAEWHRKIREGRDES